MGFHVFAFSYSLFLTQLSMKNTETEANANAIEASKSPSYILRQENLTDKIKRWYVLLLFGAFSCLTTMIWTTLNPLATSVTKIYGWDYWFLTFVMFMAGIPLCMTGMLSGWFVGKYGNILITLRISYRKIPSFNIIITHL